MADNKELIGRLNVYTEIAGRLSLANRFGSQYGGHRNIYTALGYPTTIEFEDYLKQYVRQDIAKAVINRPVAYTWKGGVLITETGNENETALEKAWVEMEDALQLKSKFVRLDKLSSIGEYGVLLMGFSDVKKPDDFKKPVGIKPNILKKVVQTNAKLELLYLKPLSQGNAAAHSYVKEPKDPRYGLIELYDIKLRHPGTDETTDLVVHHSRVIHVAPELLESEVDGEPILKPIWNRLMDLEKLVGGSAEMFWRGARPGYQGKIDPEYQVPEGMEDDLKEQLDEFENDLRRVLLNEGVEMEALAPQVADPDKHVDIQIQMISAVTGIPKRILTGSERGELASDQDLTGWYSVIQTRREEHAEANIVRPFTDRMIELGILPEPSTGEYQVMWHDLFAASDKEQAEIGKIRASALKEYAQNPAAEMIVPPEGFLQYFLGFNEDEIELVSGMMAAAVAEEERAIAAGEKPDPNEVPEPGMNGEPIEEEDTE